MSGVFLTEDERLLRLAVRELADKELAPRASHYDQNEEFPLGEPAPNRRNGAVRPDDRRGVRRLGRHRASARGGDRGARPRLRRHERRLHRPPGAVRAVPTQVRQRETEARASPATGEPGERWGLRADRARRGQRRGVDPDLVEQGRRPPLAQRVQSCSRRTRSRPIFSWCWPPTTRSRARTGIDAVVVERGTRRASR